MTTQPKLAEFKVKALPETLLPNARYVVKAADVDYVQEYITDAQGVAFPHRADIAMLADAEAAKNVAEQNAAWALAHAQSAKFEADRAQAALLNVVNAGGVETKYTQVLDDIATAFDGTRVAFDLNLGGNDVLPYSAAQILWTLGGVPQKAGVDFTVVGSALIAAAAPATGLSSELRLLQSYVDNDANATIVESSLGAFSSIVEHIGNTSNPHGVTKAQVGLGNVQNVAQLSAITALDDIAASFDGVSTTFALKLETVAYTPTSVNHLIINLGGALQSDCTLSGSNLTFATAPAAGLTCSIRVLS